MQLGMKRCGNDMGKNIFSNSCNYNAFILHLFSLKIKNWDPAVEKQPNGMIAMELKAEWKRE